MSMRFREDLLVNSKDFRLDYGFGYKFTTSEAEGEEVC